MKLRELVANINHRNRGLKQTSRDLTCFEAEHRILQLSILNFQEENTTTSSAFPNIKSQTLFPKN